MKIAIAQIECQPGDIAANISHMVQSVELAQEEGCQLVVFPELSDTGYWPEKLAEYAKPWPDPAYEALRAASAEHSIAVVAGLSERVGVSIYNSLVFFDTSGELTGKYRKIHLFSPPPASEPKYCTPGSDISLVDFGGIRWGLTICYDLRFPELHRILTIDGAQVLLNVAAWPAARPTHWDHLTRARAIENQAFVVAANRVGSDGPFQFHGHSRVVSPTGELLAEAGEDEELLVAEIDTSLIEAFRSTIPALADRRPDMYGPLGHW